MLAESRERLAVALRVLNAYTSYTRPSDEDLLALQALFPEEEQFRPPDELARTVVEREIQASLGNSATP
jgi:hypothetical protein